VEDRGTQISPVPKAAGDEGVIKQMNRIVRAHLKKLYDWKGMINPSTKPTKLKPEFTHLKVVLTT
jgi:hypothetical protein